MRDFPIGHHHTSQSSSTLGRKNKSKSHISSQPTAQRRPQELKFAREILRGRIRPSEFNKTGGEGLNVFPLFLLFPLLRLQPAPPLLPSRPGAFMRNGSLPQAWSGEGRGKANEGGRRSGREGEQIVAGGRKRRRRRRLTHTKSENAALSHGRTDTKDTEKRFTFLLLFLLIA